MRLPSSAAHKVVLVDVDEDKSCSPALGESISRLKTQGAEGAECFLDNVNNTKTGEQHWLMDEKERAAGSGPKADRAAMMRKVKRWIGKRKRGKWITAAMYRDVRDNLRTREKDRTRGSVKAVEAAIVMLLAEGDMMLEYRNRQEGKWMKGAMVWAMEQGWVSGIQAAAFMAGATDKVRYREGREMICLELGSGWRGANEGLTTTGDWDRVVDVDMKQHNLGKKLAMAKPDILVRFLMPGQEGKWMVEYFRERSGAKPGEIAAIWASANCDWASQATRLGVSRGIVMGPNSGGEVPEEEDRTIRGLIEGLQAARAEDPRVQYTWENTDGSLKDHEAMMEHMGESIKVRSCAYGRKSGKAYRIIMAIHRGEKVLRPNPASRPRLNVRRLQSRETATPAGLLPAKGIEAKEDKRGGTDRGGSEAEGAKEAGATPIECDEGGVGRSEREAEWRTHLRQQLGVKDDRKVGGIVEDIPESSVEMQHGVDPTAVVVMEPIYNLVRANKQRVKPPLKRPPPKKARYASAGSRDKRGPQVGTRRKKRKAPAAPIRAEVESTARAKTRGGTHPGTCDTHQRKPADESSSSKRGGRQENPQ